jgi:membrane-associated phospholipid phosphatase
MLPMRFCIAKAHAFFIAIIFSAALSTEACASDGIERAGDILQIVLPAGAAALTIAEHDPKGLGQLAESGALTLGVTYGLKYAIAAKRPDGGSHSFPSGHTSISFCASEFIRERYGWGYAIPAYLASSFVGYSRVESKRHYTRDVIAGAAIGIGSSALFTTPSKGWKLQAEAGTSYYGIGLTCRW